MVEQLPDTLPAARQATVTHLVNALAQVSGVVTIVLGGSYASGTAKAAYRQDLYAILAAPGSDAPMLTRTVVALEPLWQQAIDLTGDSYRPKFVVP